MKRTITVLLVLAALVCIVSVTLAVSTGSVRSDSTTYSSLSEPTRTDSITFLGRTEKLYREYTDMPGALSRFNSAYPVFISAVCKSAGLTSLTDSNWRSFIDAMYGFMNSTSNQGRYNNQFESAKDFFDIYENKAKNDKAKSVLSKDSAAELSEYEISSLLPSL